MNNQERTYQGVVRKLLFEDYRNEYKYNEQQCTIDEMFLKIDLVRLSCHNLCKAFKKTYYLSQFDAETDQILYQLCELTNIIVDLIKGPGDLIEVPADLINDDDLNLLVHLFNLHSAQYEKLRMRLTMLSTMIMVGKWDFGRGGYFELMHYCHVDGIYYELRNGYFIKASKEPRPTEWIVLPAEMN